MPSSAEDGYHLLLAGEHIQLLGGRALFWAARRRLVIADLHLGKSHVFRQSGIAVPRGATQVDLLHLSQLVAATAAEAVWIIGDVLHGPARPADWRESWMAWRHQHRQLDVAALIGNHDRALTGAGLDIRLLGEVHPDGPFVFRHIPLRDIEGRHVIAGHVHPQARLAGVPRPWPAFWIRPDITVLPAFSEFTGGHTIPFTPGQTLVACVEGAAIPLQP